MPNPAPAAAPFTCARMGFSMARSRETMGLYVFKRCARKEISPLRLLSAPRSCPAQKPLPAPVSTRHRAASSRSAFFSASCTSSAIWSSKALSTSGRLRVRVKTPSARSVRIVVLDMRASLHTAFALHPIFDNLPQHLFDADVLHALAGFEADVIVFRVVSDGVEGEEGAGEAAAAGRVEGLAVQQAFGELMIGRLVFQLNV